MAQTWNGFPLINDETPVDDLFNVKDENGNLCGRGYVERDFNTHPHEMFAPPSTMPLIDPSEYDARIEEQERMASSLEHIYLGGPKLQPRFTNLDQNGQGYCHDDKSEVLTERGWVAWPDYNYSDLLATVNPITHQMEFQAPTERHVYEYDGDMVYSTNRRVNFGVTPDHQMYVRKWDESRRTLSPNYTFVRAGDIGWYAGLLHAPSGWAGTDIVELEVPGDRRYDGDDFFAMLGLVISDGYAGGTENTRNWVSFASFRADTRGAIAALAQRVGFHEVPSRPGVWVRYDAGALAAWIRANCYVGGELGSRNKRCPDLVKCASMRQIKHFLSYFDDRSRNGLQFYSTSKRLIDDLQELHMRVGKRSSIGTVPAKDTPYSGNAAGVISGGSAYVLTVGEADRLCIDRKKHIETERYKGLVYCAAVPNHTLITRRNGSVLISSNCWSYSTGHTIMIARLRDNQPAVRLNPHAAACIIKGGRDEGGWCGLSAQWGRENGFAEEGTGEGQWPLHGMDLRRDTPALRTSMAKYKITEDWVDMAQPVYGQNLTQQQLASCLLMNQPCAVDFAWWGHSVCGIRWVKVEAGSYGLLILNSWKGWGRNGLAVLQGSKMNTMGAICSRVVKAA